MAYRSHYVQWAHIDELPLDDLEMIARISVEPTMSPYRQVDQTLMEQSGQLGGPSEDELVLDLEVPLPPLDTAFIALSADADIGVHDHWASTGAWTLDRMLSTEELAPERHVYYADPDRPGRYIYWPDARQIIPPLPRQAVSDGDVWHAHRLAAGQWQLTPLLVGEFDAWDERSAAEQDEDDEPDELPSLILAPPEPHIDVPAEQQALARYYARLLEVELSPDSLPEGTAAIRREMQVFISRTNRQ
jgi:hypothetical protein